MKQKLFLVFLLLSCWQIKAEEFITLRSETAGTLQLTEDALMATHLKIEGHIDARDFATLKEVTISRTRILDLSDAIIDAYKGYGCWINLGSSHIVRPSQDIEYQANVLPGYAFSEARDNSLYKWCEGSTTLRRIILPKTLVDIHPLAFVACKALTELRTVENSELKSVDNAIIYTKDEKRLVKVAPAYAGKLELSQRTETVDSCALSDVTLSGLVITSDKMPTFKGADQVTTAYVESKFVDECKALFPNTDCMESLETIEVTNNEKEGILAALGELGYRRDDVRSVVVNGTLSDSDIKALFALPNLYYADLSNATTTTDYVEMQKTRMCEVKMPKGNYSLAMYNNAYLCGDLVLPEGIIYLYYAGNNHRSVRMPSTLTYISEDSFQKSHVRKVDFSVCVGLLEMKSVFSGCTNLETLILPPSLEILTGVSNAPLTHITLPESLKTMGAFYRCDLEEVVFPSSLECLDGYGGLYEMPRLKRIDASKATKLTQINNDHYFDNCPYVESVDFSQSPIENFTGFNGGNDTVPQTRVVAMGGTRYPAPFIANRLSKVKLPSTLKTLSGFKNSPLLTEVDLEHCYRLEKVEGFEGCTQLTEISVPANLTQFALTLKGCDNVQSIRCAALQPPTITSSLQADKMQQITVYVPIGRKGVYYMSEGWENCKEVVEAGYSVMLSENATSALVHGLGMYAAGESVTLSSESYMANELQRAVVKGWNINGVWHEGETVTFVPDANSKVTPVYGLTAPDFSLAQISFSLEAKSDTTHYLRLGLNGTAKIYDENGVLLQDKSEGYREYTLQLHKGIQRFAITGGLYHVLLNDYNEYNTTVMSDLRIKDDKLHYLTAYYLGIQEVDLTGCPGLYDIILSNNALKELDLSGCPLLGDLNASNNALQTISLGERPNLTRLDLSANSLHELDLEGCPALEYLSVGNNAFPAICLGEKPNLTSLSLSNNSLHELDLEGCPALESLSASNNALQTISLREKPNLISLHLSGNSLQELDLEGCPVLEYLSVENNAFQTISLGEKPNLTYLYLSGNSLQELDLEGCPSLEYLSAYNNALQTISLGEKPNLISLDLDNNSLQELDLDGCPALERLYVNNNVLQTVNMGNCTQLESVDVGRNELKHLDVPNDQMQWFRWEDNPMAFSCLTPQIYESLKQAGQISDEYQVGYSFKIMKDMVDENGILDLTYELDRNAYSSATEIVVANAREEAERGKFLLPNPEGYYLLTMTNPYYPQLRFQMYFRIADLTGIEGVMKENLKISVAGNSVSVGGLKEGTALTLISANGMVLDKKSATSGEAVLNGNGYKGVCVLRIANGGATQEVKIRL